MSTILAGSFLDSVAARVKVNPDVCFGVVVGDLNIKAQNERSFKLGRNLEGSVRDRGYINPLCHGHLLGLWRKILNDWTEVVQPFLAFLPQILKLFQNRSWLGLLSF